MLIIHPRNLKIKSDDLRTLNRPNPVISLGRQRKDHTYYAQNGGTGNRTRNHLYAKEVLYH